MGQNQHPINTLVVYRKRMGFSQKQVAHLLGHRSTTMLSRYEHGRCLPPFLTALRLEIVYRIPVAFLFDERYRHMREEIRREEERLKLPTQKPLF